MTLADQLAEALDGGSHGDLLSEAMSTIDVLIESEVGEDAIAGMVERLSDATFEAVFGNDGPLDLTERQAEEIVSCFVLELGDDLAESASEELPFIVEFARGGKSDRGSGGLVGRAKSALKSGMKMVFGRLVKVGRQARVGARKVKKLAGKVSNAMTDPSVRAYQKKARARERQDRDRARRDDHARRHASAMRGGR